MCCMKGYLAELKKGIKLRQIVNVQSWSYCWAQRLAYRTPLCKVGWNNQPHHTTGQSWIWFSPWQEASMSSDLLAIILEAGWSQLCWDENLEKQLYQKYWLKLQSTMLRRLNEWWWIMVTTEPNDRSCQIKFNLIQLVDAGLAQELTC